MPELKNKEIAFIPRQIKNYEVNITIRNLKSDKYSTISAQISGTHSWLQCLNRKNWGELNDFWKLRAAHKLTYTYTYLHSHRYTHRQRF